MKTMVVLLVGMLSVTFTVDAHAAKKSKSKSHKHHAALKHESKKKVAHKRKPAAADSEKLAMVSKPKRHDIVVNMTEHVNASERPIEVDPNRPLTW